MKYFKANLWCLQETVKEKKKIYTNLKGEVKFHQIIQNVFKGKSSLGLLEIVRLYPPDQEVLFPDFLWTINHKTIFCVVIWSAIEKLCFFLFSEWYQNQWR